MVAYNQEMSPYSNMYTVKLPTYEERKELEEYTYTLSGLPNCCDFRKAKFESRYGHLLFLLIAE